MAKSTGLAWTTCSVGDAANSLTAIRTDVTNLDFSTPRPVQDITSIDLSAYERLLLLADFSVTLNGSFNPVGAHNVFRTINVGNNRATTLTVLGSSLVLTGVLYTDYTVKRDANGALSFSAAGSLADGAVPTWA